jgi:hypothetical protein
MWKRPAGVAGLSLLSARRKYLLSNLGILSHEVKAESDGKNSGNAYGDKWTSHQSLLVSKSSRLSGTPFQQGWVIYYIIV